MTKVLIDSVRINFSTRQRVVCLWDEVGRRILVIWIAKAEALPIALGLTGIETPRPLTIHFMASMMKATGVQLEAVHIETLKDNIFYAIAKVRNGDLVKDIDVRPSDALSLSLLMKCPIFVAEDLLERGGIVIPEDKSRELFWAERWLEKNGITLPEGKTIHIKKSDKEKQQADASQAIEELMNPIKTPPTAEEIEQAKQRHLAYLLGEDA